MATEPASKIAPEPAVPTAQPRNPLHGITLEAMLTELVAHFGWAGLAAEVPIKSFTIDPSIRSSLAFLRKTPWAREKVESLYLYMRREQAREARRSVAATGNGGAPAVATGSGGAPAAAPFGSWRSPITAGLIAGATIRLGQAALRGGVVYWTEGRPTEAGRTVLVACRPDGAIADVTPLPFNVRTRAHEYGGGAYALLVGGGVVFVDDADQQLHRLDEARGPGHGEAPVRLTDAPLTRYADGVHDARRQRLIAVREDHRAAAAGGAEAVATLVAVDLRSGATTVLAAGHDFYASPRLSPDGRRLAWLSWDHPDMPWDATTLWLAEVAADGSLEAPRRIAGGPGESVFQPAWSPAGDLHFVSDRSGWWNLYRWRDGDGSSDGAGTEAGPGTIQPLHPMAAEFATPQWVFGMSTYGFDGRGRIVCVHWQDGIARLGVLEPDGGPFEVLPLPFCAIEGLVVEGDSAVFIGATADTASALVRLDLPSGGWQTLRASSSAPPPAGFVSHAEAITFVNDRGQPTHAFHYPPVNRDQRGPAGERPPLIVIGHGGPTSATDAAFKWSVQFWTSRGFAVVDVNYGGSSGWGRAYRERLHGQWGVVDVDDLIAAARHLIARGDADPNRTVIRGASAGGYTALSALAFRRFFKAGASHYGIGDLETLIVDTHKFESRYLDRLVGPYPAERQRYRERSPIHAVDRLASPMILFQGAEDKAVPPAQAEAMYAAVKAKGLPVAYLLFEGEQHGFRQAATIRRALEAELYFYGRVFGFTPADAIELVVIANLPDADAAVAPALG